MDNTGLVQPLWSGKLVECLQEALGPGCTLFLMDQGRIGTGIDTEIKDMCTDGGEKARLPAADRTREVMEETFGQKSLNMRRRRLALADRDLCLPVFKQKGLTCRQKPEATSLCLDVDSGAWVEQRSFLRHSEAGSLMRCASAIRTSLPWLSGPDLWSHGTFGVHELEDRVEDEPQDHMDFGSDAEFESEVEAIVAALRPISESDAVEVPATWKQTRMAMTQEKLN